MSRKKIEEKYCIPHFFPQSAKVTHSWEVGMSSKFSKMGNFEGPGGKFEGFVNIFFTSMTPQTAATISSKTKPVAMVGWIWVGGESGLDNVKTDFF